jgi:hypothetical protein
MLKWISNKYDVRVWTEFLRFVVVPKVGCRDLCNKTMKAVFWVVAQCSLVETDSRFRRAACLHHMAHHH